MEKVINLLSGPRNISTALMYSFSQRPETKVLDEPFYAYYLSNAHLSVQHPAHEAVVNAMPIEIRDVIHHIKKISENQTVFLKGMAHHILDEKPAYLLDWENIILIRNPKKLIVSFSKVIKNPTLNDIGIKKAVALFLFLKKQGKTPLVIDSDTLMVHPENYLRKLCHFLKIPFSNKMLKWEKGGIPEDGVWAKHWYANVHNTTGFKIQQNELPNVPLHLEPLLAEAMPFYEILQQYILKNE